MNFFQLFKIKITKVFSIFKRSSNPRLDEPSNDLKNSIDLQVQKIDPRMEVINASGKLLSKVKLLANFFNKEILNNIKDQTEIVNEIFIKNKDLNFKKLEQFNYYYTVNLIELLTKIKKSKEENILILNEKLLKAKSNANSTKITRVDLKKVENERKKYANLMSEILAYNYRELCNYKDIVMVKHTHNDTLFLKTFPTENYYTIPFETYEEFGSINQDLFYTSKTFSIHKKLIGKLNKNVFNIQYLYTLKSTNDDEVYIFQIKDTSDFFIYVPDKKCFKLVESTDVLPLCDSSKSSWYLITVKLEEDLKRIEDLEYRISNEKVLNDPSILNTLEDYYKKINNNDLLTNLSEIDVERQFLDEVLKLEQFKI